MSDKNRILDFLKHNENATLESIAKNLDIKINVLIELLKNMEIERLVTIKYTDALKVEVTKEGKIDIEEGFPEEKLLNEAKKSKLHLSNVDNIALGWAKRNGWVSIIDNYIKITDKGERFDSKEYKLKEVLIKLNKEHISSKELSDLPPDILKILESRNLIIIKNSRVPDTIVLSNDSNLNDNEISQLTRSMIKERSWDDAQFKRYDINAGFDITYPARMHPTRIFLNRIASIWVSMGFTEVKGPIIEPAFWNFDTLFIPQDHPSRDTQDTFFLSNPKDLDISDIELMSKFKKEHKRYWKYEMNEKISGMGVLRTQTTSVSARQMRIIGKSNNLEYPIKLFSIGKVFRNESIDYKHLAEFYQLEGLVVGPSLSLAHLIGIIKEFALNIGIDIKIRPSSFAFVEPGLEVYFYSERHKTNIELCGGGIIRKEITNSMGIKKPVLAWGMGLDRVIMDELKLDSITELYKNQLGWLRTVSDINSGVNV